MYNFCRTRKPASDRGIPDGKESDINTQGKDPSNSHKGLIKVFVELSYF